ncbi:unnamed protein product [Rotaria sordida]|uniref:Uncharacterized protein n=1 Tax=Rotaria sordida TaxID=392033 RepID=A0A818RJI6_9BILA|nr:unnamed protein product [Rotaria sordida]CAF0975792.1 unnamed protein product [Rotaria sordida]CAF1060717.1 unnamed protein product [Rotaria sordida]CAF1276375.1 unnamed protein product [Rotaria sordida]CAF1325122.1 unnamed protein product [Rotaria sordida]
MAPKKSKAAKASLKKSGTMAATAAAGQEFLKQAWGEDKLNRVNALLEARDKSDTSDVNDTTTASSTAAGSSATTTSSSKTKAKPKLSKARTMKTTAKEAKTLIGKEVLGDTRAETKRRQAAVKAEKTLQEVTKPTTGRRPGIKRLGTMANTAREGKAYIKRTAGNKQKGKSTTGRKRTGRGRAKQAAK